MKHEKGPWENKSGLTVIVKYDNSDKAMRAFKKLITQENLVREVRSYEYYETGSEKRRREKNEARARHIRKMKNNIDE